MKHKKKVVLLNPAPAPPINRWHGTPLAVLSVSSFLEKQGYDIHIIADFLYSDFERELLEQCADSVCLGITAFSGYQIFEGLRTARIIRERYPSLPIVWGGWHPSMLPDQTVSDPNVDIVVNGQGERAFTELVNALYYGDSLDQIQGLIWKEGDSVHVNLPRPMEDVNNFLPVPYHLVDVEKCLVETDYGRRGLMYVSSYGCPHRCSFCIEPILNKRLWSALEADRVVSEWEYLVKKYNLDSIIVYDSNFFTDKKRVYRICSELIQRNIRIKIVGANGRISQLVRYEPEVWEVMQRAGLASILTGAESGDQDSLNLLQKDMTVEQNLQFAKLCDKYDVRILYSYLIGTPWSDDPKENAAYVEKEYQATITHMNELFKISNKNRFMWFIYTPYPGSELFQRAVQLGFNPPTSLEGWSTVVLTPSTAQERGWITEAQVRRTLIISNYIWELMHATTYERVKARVTGKMIRVMYSTIFPLAVGVARLRWKFKFFGLPIDYYLYLRVRKYFWGDAKDKKGSWIVKQLDIIPKKDMTFKSVIKEFRNLTARL